MPRHVVLRLMPSLPRALAAAACLAALGLPGSAVASGPVSGPITVITAPTAATAPLDPNVAVDASDARHRLTAWVDRSGAVPVVRTQETQGATGYPPGIPFGLTLTSGLPSIAISSVGPETLYTVAALRDASGP